MACTMDPHTNAYGHGDSLGNSHRNIDHDDVDVAIELAFTVTLQNGLCYSVSHPQSPERHAHGLDDADALTGAISYSPTNSDCFDDIVALSESITHEITFAHDFADCVTVTHALALS